MGKRKQSGGNSNNKRQRCHALVEPGQYGIYATCARFKEVAAAKEMRLLLQNAIEKYYPQSEEQETIADNDDDNDNEKEKKIVNVEDEIAKEIAELKKNDDKAKHNRNNKDLILREVTLGVESLTFFKLRQPVKPSELVVNICRDIDTNKDKSGRFVQRMVGIDRSCNATETEFIKMLSAALRELKDEEKIFETYNVNLVKRNFDTISRDDFMALIQKEMDACFGQDQKQLRYKGAQILINVYCFKNNIGLSIINHKDYDNLCKFNVQQLHERILTEETPTIKETGQVKKP
jgi:tRNA acetyltransferase TAN1